MKGDGEMETSLRHFYRRGTDALALAFSILANLVLVVAVFTTAFSLMTANAHAEIAVSRAATAKTPPLNDGLPEPGFKITAGDTAIVITDPQNDFLSPDGVTWGVVGKSITENGTVENLGALFKVADQTGVPVFVSPHYYYEHDHKWRFEGTLETLMHDLGMFDRPHALTLDGFEGSGAD